MTQRLYLSLKRHGDFNPHEREARDSVEHELGAGIDILIHTSVKLVTQSALLPHSQRIF